MKYLSHTPHGLRRAGSGLAAAAAAAFSATAMLLLSVSFPSRSPRTAQRVRITIRACTDDLFRVRKMFAVFARSGCAAPRSLPEARMDFHIRRRSDTNRSSIISFRPVSACCWRKTRFHNFFQLDSRATRSVRELLIASRLRQVHVRSLSTHPRSQLISLNWLLSVFRRSFRFCMTLS